MTGPVSGANPGAGPGANPDELLAAATFGRLSVGAAPLVPLYLRRPDATPPKPKPKSPAIPDVPADVGLSSPEAP